MRQKVVWHSHFKLADRLHEFTTGKVHQLFPKAGYIDPPALLAKQMRDDVVFGKPLFQLYAKTLKPADLNFEFGGIHKPFNVFK
jgi:hypothetical protein